MTVDLSGAPFPLTYRELWLPRGINENASLPSSRYNGHPLTFTGARRGTTCNGARFDGSINSFISFPAIHDAAAKLWVSLRFKISGGWTPGSGQRYLWGKRIGANDRLVLWYDTADSKLHWGLWAAGAVFDIVAQDGGADITSWEKNRWYHVLASISDTVGVGRLIVDNGTVVLTNDVTAAPNGGNIVFGRDRPGGGAAEAHRGIIADAVMGTDDLTPAEEAELYNGIPPADAVNFHPLDEGRGVTAYDRGSGVNNGTLAAACTWGFGQVQQPIISFDSINDRAASSVGVDISGDLTLVWAGKMKSTYDALTVNQGFVEIRIDANNRLYLVYSLATDAIGMQAIGSGVGDTVRYTAKPSIDDYLIFIGTLTLGGTLAFYVNGSLIGVATGIGAIAGLPATAYIGANNANLDHEISKPLFVGLIDGAFDQKQALAYSRYLKNVFNLPIAV